MERADANKEHMGLTTWENAPDGKILKTDVMVAKNYLSEQEMHYLERIVSLYLDYAELQAERKIPMSMEDWAKRLDGFLEFNGNELLTGPGKISAEQAKRRRNMKSIGLFRIACTKAVLLFFLLFCYYVLSMSALILVSLYFSISASTNLSTSIIESMPRIKISATSSKSCFLES